MRTTKKPEECGAWVQVKGRKVKCDRGKHRGAQHSYSFEFFIENPDYGQESWRTATVAWRT